MILSLTKNSGCKALKGLLPIKTYNPRLLKIPEKTNQEPNQFPTVLTLECIKRNRTVQRQGLSDGPVFHKIAHIALRRS